MSQLKLLISTTLLCLQTLTCFASTESVTLEKIKQSKTVTIGVREAAAPFAVYSNGVGKGYSVDICNSIVSGLEKHLSVKLDVKYVPVTSQNRIDMVKSGKVDLECGSTTSTRDRIKEVEFSYPIFITGARISVRKGSTITDYKNMANARVAVVRGSSAEILMQAVLNTAMSHGQGFVIVPVENNNDGVNDLASGKVDVFSTDDILMAGAIASNGLENKLIRTGSFISIEPYAIMSRKDDLPFLKLVDSMVAEQLTSGRAQQLLEKWFDTPSFHYKVNNLTASNFNFPAKSIAFP